MLIFRQREFGAYPATWGKELISLAKKGKRDELAKLYDNKVGSSRSLELKRFRRDLKPTGGYDNDILASKERYIKDVIKPQTERTGRSFESELRSRKDLMKDVIAIRQNRAASEGPRAYEQFKRIKNATPINRRPEEMSDLAWNANADNKAWRIEQARYDQKTKLKNAQAKMQLQDYENEMQKGSKRGFLGRLFNR